MGHGPRTGVHIIGSRGSQAFASGRAAAHTGSPGPPVRRWQLMGLPGPLNCLGHFLAINQPFLLLLLFFGRLQRVQDNPDLVLLAARGSSL